VDLGVHVHAHPSRHAQRPPAEIAAARRVAKAYRVRDHVVVDIDLRTFGGSALTADIDVPKDRLDADLATGIPITYVPARNTIFLSFGLAWSEVLGASDIFIGVNALDYSGYPDCRPEYVAAFQRMANLATKGGVEGTLPVRLQTPLLQLTKRQIVELGLSLGVDYTLTLSCYDPSDDGRACGHCDSCQLRRRGFTEAGVTDPTRYVGVD
jgi:7-cyano-7-deazaguanine synthase